MLAAWFVWLRRGRSVSARLVDYWYGKAQAAPASLRRTFYFAWNSPRLADPIPRGRRAFWNWLVVALFAPALAAVLFVGAAHARR